MSKRERPIPRGPHWRKAWNASHRRQQWLRDEFDAELKRGMAILAANTTMLERAQAEYDYCTGRTSRYVV